MHPVSLGCFGQQSYARLPPGLVATTLAPDKGVSMRIPIGCSFPNGLGDVFPGLEAPPACACGTHADRPAREDGFVPLSIAQFSL